VTGSCDFLTENDEESIAKCRKLLSYLPQNRKQMPWEYAVDSGDDPNRRDDALLDIVAADLSVPYDMRNLVARVMDQGQFFELQELFAPNMVIGFGRMDGKTVGVVANNPMVKGGYIDLDACDKEARFIRFCDAFNIPLLFFVDTPGFLPGVEQERSPQGLLRRAAKAVFAVCEATVPKISVCVGTSHGPARLAMGTPREGVDMVFSWPQARVARLDPKEVVEIIWKDEIAQAEKPGKVREEKYRALLDTYIDYPFHAAEYLMVDEIIDPRDTRREVIKRLEVLTHKEAQARPWRKHVLMPR
jgi:acetyl-CoA/propionyl-CoA carboxylase